MNRSNLIRFAFAAVLLAAASAAAAQYGLQIIPLRHRTTEQVLPALQPLLEPGGTLTGQGNQLIVRASPANLAELRRALEAIDRPARRLQISVRFDDALAGTERELGGSARIGSAGSRIEIRARESQTGAEERVDQRVHVLDGGRATIYTGRSTLMQETTTGFDVMPRVLGGRVEVDVLATRDLGEMSGPVREARVATTASGGLGQWFLLGAVAGGEARSVWIRVDPLP